MKSLSWLALQAPCSASDYSSLLGGPMTSDATRDASEQRLRAELVAARAENELLLQQITRLCLFVEQRTGCDPIAS